MKILALYLILVCICFPAYATDYRSNIESHAPGNYRLIYPNQSISIYFETCQIPSYHNFIKIAELSENERYTIVKTIKKQLDLLPADFIQKYLDVNIYPFHIIRENDFGFYYNKEIVIDIDKIKPQMSYVESITSTLMYQLFAIALNTHKNETSTVEIREYLQKFNASNPYDPSSQNAFKSAYVNPQAAGREHYLYNFQNELSETFAFLFTYDIKNKLQQFMELNPNSLLTQKIEAIVDYLITYSPAFNWKFFFDSKIPSVNSLAHEISIIDGGELLSLHEIKSYESYDFDQSINEEAFEVNNLESPVFVDNRHESDEIYVQTRNSEIETLFGNQQEDQPKQKKRKRKKDGTGLLILGGLLYLTLELLSQ